VDPFIRLRAARSYSASTRMPLVGSASMAFPDWGRLRVSLPETFPRRSPRKEVLDAADLHRFSYWFQPFALGLRCAKARLKYSFARRFRASISAGVSAPVGAGCQWENAFLK
jgi:hypothetical protein